MAGAFDRVSIPRLLKRLKRKGVHPKLLKVIESWLGKRYSIVIVDGVSSQPQALSNSVYQGTVLGHCGTATMKILDRQSMKQATRKQFLQI